MQIYAIDKSDSIAAPQAEKKKDYTCPECKGPVRVRGGDIRQSHFFHLHSSKSCRLAQKGLIHLRLQKFIQYLFEDEAVMERAFPEIGRIADVACLESKKIFEIQYSPITLEEARQRCLDYESLGFHVIWILHEETFNQFKVGPSEAFLRSKTCYFSDMDAEGNGMIYDQIDILLGKKRKWLTKCCEVNLRDCKRVPKPHRWPIELSQRGATWPLYHDGDFLDFALRKKWIQHNPRKQNTFEKLKEAYLGCLQLLLEKSSK